MEKKSALLLRLLLYVCAIITIIGTYTDDNESFYRIIPILIPLSPETRGNVSWLWIVGFSFTAIYYWSTIEFEDAYLIATLLSVVAAQPI